MGFWNNHKRGILITVTIICIISIGLTTFINFKPELAADALGFIITPGQKVSMQSSKWFSDKIDLIMGANDLLDENNRLKEQINELETENQKLKLYEDENIKLTELLNMRQKYPRYLMSGAEITSKDPNNWYYVYTIDKGKRDNVTPDMVVISTGGLVGHIMESSETYSKVLAIIDARSSVSVMNARTEDKGIVKGDYSLMTDGYCKMEFIDNDSIVLEGDEIITSHISDIYPPGIVVGTVKEVRTDTNGLTRYAIIKPAVDFKYMEKVLLIDRTINEDRIGGSIIEE